MSKQVDDRVVSMQFDNKNFESNVHTSLTTLEKLKRALNFKGASKGLDNLSASAKNVNFSTLANSVETVSSRFSALEVMGVTALAKITNAAMNAGTNIVKSLTIAPIMDGFREYETNINSVQTILANTQHKGSTIEDVNSALDELNHYADQTIYNFAEMTRNIGTFTAAGVDLDKSVTSIKGIANLAAMSGSTSQQASTAMYQLSQALAAGKVSLMDWNSVVNAGMGGEVFQNALKRTAEQMGTNVDAMIEKYGSFRESLTKGEWLTAEVLTETLTQLSGAYTEADLIAQGYTEQQAKDIIQLSETALDAATKVKTFTQLFDTMKEAAGSGWAQTWETIIGDFDEAKELLTNVSEFFTGDNGLITKMSDSRNNLLEGALNSNWEKLGAEIEAAGIPLQTFTDKLTETAKKHNVDIDKMIEKHGSFKKAMEAGAVSGDIVIETIKNIAGSTGEFNSSTAEMTDKLEYFQKVVNEVWHGDFKNGEERVKALTEAGYNYAEVQDLVNKTVDGHKLTLDDLSESQLKSIGYTDEQIESIKKLAAEAEKSGSSLNDLINSLSQKSGRVLIWESMANLAQPIVTVLKAIGEAWNDAFPPMAPKTLYNIIKGFHGFTEALRIGEDNAKNLTRTLKGVFAILDIVTTVIGGGFKMAFSIASKVVETLWKALGFGTTNILEITAAIGDAIVGFRDWFESINPITKAIEIVVPLLVEFGKAIFEVVKSLGKIPAVQSVLKSIADGFDWIVEKAENLGKNVTKHIEDFADSLENLKDLTLDDVIKGIKKFGKTIQDTFSNFDELFENIPDDIISGLLNGLKAGVSKVVEPMIEIGEAIIEAIKGILGIHSPSTVMYEIGQNIIEGLVNGISAGLQWIIDGIKRLGSIIIDSFDSVNFDPIINTFKDFGSFIGGVFDKIDFRKIASVLLALIPAGIVIVIVKRISDIVKALADGITGINDVLEGFVEIEKQFAKVLGGVTKVLGSFSMKLKADALKSLAIAIAILVGSIIALTFVNPEKLYGAIGALVLLAGVLAALSFAVSKMDVKDLEFGKLSAMLLSLSASVLLLAWVTKIVGSMDPDEAKQGFIGLGGLIIAISGVLAAYGLLVKGAAAKNIDKAGKMIKKIAWSLLILTGVVKLISMLEWSEMGKGAVGMLGFIGFVAALTAVSKLAGKRIDKIGGLILKISIAMGLMVGVIKLITLLSPDEMIKGAAFALAFTGFVALLVGVTKIAGGQQIAKVGGLLLAVSTSMMLMVGVIKMVSMLSVGELIKGGAAILAFVGIVALLVGIVTIGNDKQMGKVGGTLLAMSLAIGIIAGIAVLLGIIDTGMLAKGVIAVSILGAIMALMVHATKGAQNCVGNIVAMTVAIGIMTGAVALLSTIEPSKLAGATAALTILMGMFALIEYTGSNIKSSVGTLLVMSIAVGALGGILYLIAGLPVENALAASASLSGLLLAFSAALLIISKAGPISTEATIAIGVMTLVTGALAGILYLLQGLPVESTLAVAASLSVLLLSLSASLAIISLVGPMANNSLLAVGVMTLVVAALGGILYLLQDLPVDSTIAIAASLSLLLLSLSGACLILAGVGATGPAAFIGIGALLTLITSVGALMGAIGALVTYFPQLEDFLNRGLPILEKIGYGLGSFVGNIVGGFMDGALSGLPEIGTHLSSFMTNAQPFIDGARGIDEGVATGVKALATAILALTGAGILDAATSWLTGGNTLSQFGTELVAFGVSMAAYSVAVAGIDAAAVEASAQAAKSLVKVAQAIPNEGGLVSLFTGDNNIGKFGDSLVPFGKGMKKYSEAVTGIDAEAINASATAAKALVKVAETIPNDGGVAGFFAGNNNIGDFGDSIAPFGKGMKKYSDAVVGIDVEAINSSVSAAKKIVSLMNSINGVNTGGVGSFVSALNTLGTANVNNFVKAFSGSSSQLNKAGSNMMDSLIKGIKSKQSSLKSTATTIASTLEKEVSSKSNVLNKAGVNMAEGLIKGIKSKQTVFKTVSNGLINNFVNGIKSQSPKITTAITSALSTAASRSRGYYSTFYSAGSYVASGLAAGIRANISSAANAAASMARAASDAARRNLDINSPSKVFYGIGGYAGQGFVNALTNYAAKSYRAGSEMANAARNGLGDAISTIGDLISGDIDMQPTIRPVVDLSDVKTGVSAMDRMFDRGTSVRTMLDVNSINSRMNRRSQNGTGEEIVSAINQLRKDISKLESNQYNINGITYDDGSNIKSAIEEIIRTVTMERRA